MKTPHLEFMREALRLAGKGLGSTSPNPAVGAVIVKGGMIIGRGYHKKAGLPHAEIEALASMPPGKGAKGGTIYVTLEPCCHFGRTPPCTDAVIRSGIKRAVIGLKDPNPAVSGKGVRILRAAGIEVETGILEDECRRLNEPYIKYITAGTPFVVLKLASTLDGRIATGKGESKWITGIESRRYVHRMRSAVDAVMVGSRTVIKDDPLLTVRHLKGRDPRRVVADSAFSIPLTARIFKRPRLSGGGKAPGPIIFTTRGAPLKKIRKAVSMGAEVVVVRGSKDGVSLKEVLKELGKREITSLLVEGGSRLAASFLKAEIADKLVVFLAPALLGSDAIASIGELGAGSLKESRRLRNMAVKMLGDDILVEGYL